MNQIHIMQTMTMETVLIFCTIQRKDTASISY